MSTFDIIEGTHEVHKEQRHPRLREKANQSYNSVGGKQHNFDNHPYQNAASYRLAHGTSSSMWMRARTRMLRFVLGFMVLWMQAVLVVSANTMATIPDRAAIVGGWAADTIITRRHATLYIYHRSSGDYALCGATVLARRWVLTAAHCIFHQHSGKLASGISVYAGQSSLYAGKPVYVNRIFVHSRYNVTSVWGVPTYSADIAVLRLSSSLSRNVRVMRLSKFPADEPKLGKNTRIYATGFGRVWFGGPVSSYLRTVSLRVIPFIRCKRAEPQPFRRVLQRSSTFCAAAPGFPRFGGADTCNGDSGGPLYWYRTSDGKLVQFGITSWASTGCAGKGTVAWYTRVRKYIHDIRALLNQSPTASSAWSSYP